MGMDGQSRASHVNDSTVAFATVAISLLAGKWTPRVILALANGRRRFAVLQRLLPGISHRILTKELRGLQKHGVIVRTVHPTIPPSVEYELSDSGLELCKVLHVASEWAMRHLSQKLPLV
jgi:DNA-binding HxlR family transcriptional regulator